MKILLRGFLLTAVTIFSADQLKAQLYKIELDEKVKSASLIVEGKVISKKSFWNDAHTMIFTSNTIEVYKLFKGGLKEKTIEVLTQGGSVGTDAVIVNDLLQLNPGRIGMFFCELNRINLKSPFTKNILFDVYSSAQGFLEYDLATDEARAPFVSYKKIEANLYKLVEQKAGQQHRVIDSSFRLTSGRVDVSEESGPGVMGSVTSFSPDTVHAGALDDPTNNMLTINGSGFGATPSGKCAVLFKDGNSNNTTPDFRVKYSSYYIVSWSDIKIVVKVPDRAATGYIAVETSNGTVMQSATQLNVFFSVLNAAFPLTINGYDTVYAEMRLMDANGSGGYSVQYSTSTSGGGKNFATSQAKDAFERALTTWKEAVGVNFTVGATTTEQSVANDQTNLIVFDNNNTGVPPMAAGVLESTYSYATVCYISDPFQLFPAQKTGFDILVRNNGVSAGNIPFAEGPCFPGQGTYDRETVVLHEIGHALDLAHINDPNEGNTIPNVNPQKVMHYAITDYVDRRSLDGAAYQGGLYAVTPQNNNYGGCSGSFPGEMQQIAFTVVSNDNCPTSFPVTSTPSGTAVTFDLVHATSNKLADPQFTDVNCAGTGTQVTNNVYYAFRTSDTSNGTLDLTITDYATVPPELISCAGAGVRLTVYDVSSCPSAGNFPAPIKCVAFNGNGPVQGVKGLKQDHTYLLYFDGLRNTKATFTGNFNGIGSGGNTQSSVSVFPNPVTNQLTLSITSTTATKYNCLVYDMLGRRVYQNVFEIATGSQTFNIPFMRLARGVYILKLTDENGKLIFKKNLLR